MISVKGIAVALLHDPPLFRTRRSESIPLGFELVPQSKHLGAVPWLSFKKNMLRGYQIQRSGEAKKGGARAATTYYFLRSLPFFETAPFTALSLDFFSSLRIWIFLFCRCFVDWLSLELDSRLVGVARSLASLPLSHPSIYLHILTKPPPLWYPPPVYYHHINHLRHHRRTPSLDKTPASL